MRSRKTKINTVLLKKSSEVVSKLTAFSVSKNKPVVGENAFAHESGIHQHGVINKRETYEIMDPEQVGHKTQINIGAQSGIKGIKYKLNYYNLDYKNLIVTSFDMWLPSHESQLQFQC